MSTRLMRTSLVQFFRNHRTSLTVVAAIVAIVSTLGWAQLNAEPSPEDVGAEWAATAISSATQCPKPSDTCVEWCFVYQDGSMQGTGQLCCMDSSHVGSSDYNACPSVRN